MNWVPLAALMLSGASLVGVWRRGPNRRTGSSTWRSARAMPPAWAPSRSRMDMCFGSRTSWMSASTTCPWSRSRYPVPTPRSSIRRWIGCSRPRSTPDLVTVWTGANDVIRGEDVDDFAAALENMFARLRERTDGVIVAANIPDLTELPRFRENPDEDVTRERIEAFNEAIAEQAAAHDALLVDLIRGAGRGRPGERGRISSQQRGAPPHRGGVPRGHPARARPRARCLSQQRPSAGRRCRRTFAGAMRSARGAAVTAPG